MRSLSSAAIIARWEARRFSGSLGRRVLPLALVLALFVAGAAVFASQQGLHLHDNLFRAGVSDPEVAGILSSDPQFSVATGTRLFLVRNKASFDIMIISGRVVAGDSDRGRAALLAFRRDYDQYRNSVYRQDRDTFAAYPVWIEVHTVQSELDFSTAQTSIQIPLPRPGPVAPAPPASPPVPEGPVGVIPNKEPGPDLSAGQARTGLQETADSSPVARFTGVLGAGNPSGSFRTPSQLSTPLPFDSIILLFLFIFPIYFASQFFTMSIWQERSGRAGEPLLSTPAGAAAIIVGKGLPYFLGILGATTAVILVLRAPLAILLPLLPVVLFFFASALIIAMVSRSYRELSFVSLFFACMVTSYLLLPSIFTSVHVISMISPLTLIVLTLQNEPYTALQYLYSTSLFYLAGAVLFCAGVVNYNGEQLFSQAPLVQRVREFISAAISKNHPLISLFFINALSIPFIFMAQMLVLVLVFNLPVPLSLALLLVFAALIEETVKSAGISTLILDSREGIPWTSVISGSLVTAGAFLFAEKLLLLVTLSQISDSIFGSILFLSLGALALPFLLHFAGVLVTASGVRWRGSSGYVPGILLSTMVHCLYNAYFILGAIR